MIGALTSINDTHVNTDTFPLLIDPLGSNLAPAKRVLIWIASLLSGVESEVRY